MSKWKYEQLEPETAGEPSRYRVFSTYDPSYEATLCELWSGEHDNEEMAKKICDTLNAAAPSPPPAELSERGKDLAQVKEQLREAQIKLKNMAPTGKYNGIDIDGWYRRAASADAKNRELAAQVAVVQEALEIAQDFLKSEKCTPLPWDMSSVPLNKIPKALANLPAEAEKLVRVLEAVRTVVANDHPENITRLRHAIEAYDRDLRGVK